MIKYLRFNSEDEAKVVLSEFVNNHKWKISSETHSLDVIGSVIILPAEFDENENMIAAAVVDQRFHVNFQGQMQADVSAFEVFPTTPRRVWA